MATVPFDLEESGVPLSPCPTALHTTPGRALSATPLFGSTGVTTFVVSGTDALVVRTSRPPSETNLRDVEGQVTTPGLVQ